MEEILLSELRDKVAALCCSVAEAIRYAPFTVTEKTRPENIVTSSDIKSQRMLVRGLGEIIPGSTFFCEEEGICDRGGEYVWIIDPIDGTTNFARGIEDCAISVGLLHRGEIIVGVVKSICREDCFTAVKGKGAELNGKPIRVSDRGFESGILCTAMSLYKKEFAKICSDIIFEAYSECNDVRRFGSAAMELCYLASGRCELYFEIRVFPWDCAAGILILEEAGGMARGLQDKPVDFSGPTVLIGANSEENYRKLADIVNKHLHYTPYED